MRHSNAVVLFTSPHPLEHAATAGRYSLVQSLRLTFLEDLGVLRGVNG